MAYNSKEFNHVCCLHIHISHTITRVLWWQKGYVIVRWNRKWVLLNSTHTVYCHLCLCYWGSFLTHFCHTIPLWQFAVLPCRFHYQAAGTVWMYIIQQNWDIALSFYVMKLHSVFMWIDMDRYCPNFWYIFTP